MKLQLLSGAIRFEVHGNSMWPRMTRPLLLLSLATLVGAPALAAEERGIDTARCKEAVSKIIETTGATFDRASPSGDNAFLSHPATHSFSLGCASYSSLLLFGSVDKAFPSAQFFALMATAGAAVTQVPAPTLLRYIKSCQLAALKSKDEQEETHRPHVQIDCQAFVRDGGGTSVSVSAEEDYRP